MNSLDEVILLIFRATLVFCHSPRNTLPNAPAPISRINLSSEYGIFMRSSGNLISLSCFVDDAIALSVTSKPSIGL
jgi:hypothetical protein